LLLDALPFQEGELVEIIILAPEEQAIEPASFPVRGKVLEYVDPTEPVAQDDWEALR
jgi:hypothetical protein